MTAMAQSEELWTASVAREGFAFARAEDVRARLSGALGGWDRFAAGWEGMPRDAYMADGGRDRRRRHAVLTVASDGSAALQPRQPHYQSRAYNALNGGVERWYEPMAPEIAAGAPLAAITALGASLFGRLRPAASWRVELHQFRIEATAGSPGRPTPEGVHRDGVDYVLVLLVRRENVAQGTTTVHDPSGRGLGAFTLAAPLDAAFVDDARVLHGVTPVTALDPARPAFRDVLVATYRALAPEAKS
ncbi:MAG: 2OG-Fe dioxygenase family protein [Elusimicrobia bacterium]|nr:2OG-Fe dioxygenase family protein [Elusimicrobiota bacterium]